MAQTLVFVDGLLCVRHADVYQNPETVVNYWPVDAQAERSRCAEIFPELDTPIQLSGSGRDGYRFYRGYGSWSPVIHLKDGGSTKPIKTEVIPIPCPKVRKGLDTRFERGAWQKYLKSQGWVPA
jgi:hypothetical protein